MLTIFKAIARGMFVRNKIREHAHAALAIQTAWRRYRAQKRYNQIRRAVIAIQAAFRGNQARQK